jgi:hypothetical protein
VHLSYLWKPSLMDGAESSPGIKSTDPRVSSRTIRTIQPPSLVQLVSHPVNGPTRTFFFKERGLYGELTASSSLDSHYPRRQHHCRWSVRSRQCHCRWSAGKSRGGVAGELQSAVTGENLRGVADATSMLVFQNPPPCTPASLLRWPRPSPENPARRRRYISW